MNGPETHKKGSETGIPLIPTLFAAYTAFVSLCSSEAIFFCFLLLMACNLCSPSLLPWIFLSLPSIFLHYYVVDSSFISRSHVRVISLFSPLSSFIFTIIQALLYFIFCFSFVIFSFSSHFCVTPFVSPSVQLLR